MTTFKTNTFNFDYVGKVQGASYSFADTMDGIPNLSMSHDSEKRGRILDLNFILDLQYPAYDYYNSKTMMDASNTIKVFKHYVGTQNTSDELTTTPQNQSIEEGGDDFSPRE